MKKPLGKRLSRSRYLMLYKIMLPIYSISSPILAAHAPHTYSLRLNSRSKPLSTYFSFLTVPLNHASHCSLFLPVSCLHIAQALSLEHKKLFYDLVSMLCSSNYMQHPFHDKRLILASLVGYMANKSVYNHVLLPFFDVFNLD